MMLSGEGLGVWRDDGDQLFSISMEKWMERNGLKSLHEGFREEISARSTWKVSPRADSWVRRARVQIVATELGLQKAYLLFIFKIILLTYLFLAALGLCCFSLVAASRGSSLFAAWGEGSSLRWLLLLGTRDLGCEGTSCCSPWAQSLRLPGSRAQAWQLWPVGLAALRHMWDPPGSGIEPRSPALAGGTLCHGAAREAQAYLLYSRLYRS